TLARVAHGSVESRPGILHGQRHHQRAAGRAGHFGCILLSMKFHRLTPTALALAFTLIGCQPDRPMETAPNRAIPRNAIYAKEGQGRLWFQATDNGVTYVYD